MENKLKNIKLEEIPKQDAFQAPDRYFEELSSKIQNRISENEAQSFSWTWKPILKWSPAIMILVSLITWAVINYRQADEEFDMDKYFASISDEEIILYLENSELSTVEIIETLSQDLLTPEEQLEQSLDYDLDSGDFDQIIKENLSIEDYYN